MSDQKSECPICEVVFNLDPSDILLTESLSRGGIKVEIICPDCTMLDIHEMALMEDERDEKDL